MSKMPNNRRLPRVAPLLVIGMLACIVIQRGSYSGPATYAEYHAAAATAVAAIPDRFPMGWVGEDQEVPASAVQLLRPNALRYIVYENLGHRFEGWTPRAGLLVVQCRRALDMVGHYPLNCYPAIGWTTAGEEPRIWVVEGRQIEGVEYQFVRVRDGIERRRTVYNFMIVPGVGTVPDMAGVRLAADDYRQRYYGAGQVQLVFDGPLAAGDRAARDEIFGEILARALPAIDTLVGDLPEDQPVAAAGEAENKREFVHGIR
jgi:hypothetical protein